MCVNMGGVCVYLCLSMIRASLRIHMFTYCYPVDWLDVYESTYTYHL